MPAAQRDAKREYLEAHIPQAVFFDLDAHSADSDLPHMLPPAAQFGKAIGALGIHNDDAVVVYDAAGLFSAARLWWMFRAFGHERVAVLDGGLPKWIREGHVRAAGDVHAVPASFAATLHTELLRDKEAVKSNTDALVLDARSPERFSGLAPEPRAGLRSGHIPASRNVPFSRLLNKDGTLKPVGELRGILAAANGRPVISSCGSGVTACVLDLALEVIGHSDHAVYDGSWAQWGADADCPIETTQPKEPS